VPEHVPDRYWPPGQLALEQVVQAPFAVEDEPSRYSPALHGGWFLHAVSDVPEHPPLLYLPVPQGAHAVHAKPCQNWLAPHAGTTSKNGYSPAHTPIFELPCPDVIRNLVVSAVTLVTVPP